MLIIVANQIRLYPNGCNSYALVISCEAFDEDSDESLEHAHDALGPNRVRTRDRRNVRRLQREANTTQHHELGVFEFVR